MWKLLEIFVDFQKSDLNVLSGYLTMTKRFTSIHNLR